MEGSHGGKACWLQFEDREKGKLVVARSVESADGFLATGEIGQGRPRLVVEMGGLLRRTIQHVLTIEKDSYVIEKHVYIRIRRLRLILHYRFFSYGTVVFIGRMGNIRVLSEM
jgi:hypothetical protein